MATQQGSALRSRAAGGCRSDAYLDLTDEPEWRYGIELAVVLRAT
jgi:hypothetical protein